VAGTLGLHHRHRGRPGGTKVTTEQLWARQVGDRHFELCCIPYFVYDLALGDVVEIDADYRLNADEGVAGV
jgi:hypothetical protein